MRNWCGVWGKGRTPSHRRNNRRDRGRLVPSTFRLGTDNVLVPQLLGRSFQKARHFTASSYQNAGASVFKNFPGVIPPVLTKGGGDLLNHSTPSLAFGRARGASVSVLGPIPCPPKLFSRGCAPALPPPNRYFGVNIVGFGVRFESHFNFKAKKWAKSTPLDEKIQKQRGSQRSRGTSPVNAHPE